MRPEGLRRFAEEYLSSTVPPFIDDPIAYISLRRYLPSGRFTFTDGLLWYKYRELTFEADPMGGIRSFTMHDVVPEEDDFFEQPWLLENYPKILKAKDNRDPVFVGLNRRYDFHDIPDASSLWSIETDGGWKVELMSVSNRVDFLAKRVFGDVRALYKPAE